MVELVAEKAKMQKNVAKLELFKITSCCVTHERATKTYITLQMNRWKKDGKTRMDQISPSHQ